MKFLAILVSFSWIPEKKSSPWFWSGSISSRKTNWEFLAIKIKWIYVFKLLSKSASPKTSFHPVFFFMQNDCLTPPRYTHVYRYLLWIRCRSKISARRRMQQWSTKFRPHNGVHHCYLTLKNLSEFVSLKQYITRTPWKRFSKFVLCLRY